MKFQSGFQLFNFRPGHLCNAWTNIERAPAQAARLRFVERSHHSSSGM